MLANRGFSSAKVPKVMAHANARDVAEGRTTGRAKAGNDQADVLAGIGSEPPGWASWRIPHLRERRQQLQALVSNVQCMPTSVLL